MNFLLDILPTFLIIATVAFLYSKFPRLLKGVKMEKLSRETVDNLKIRSFPQYYKLFYLIFLILCLIVYLGGIFIIFFTSTNSFYSLQKFTFGSNAIYFTSASQLIFGIVMFLAGCLWWGGLFSFLMCAPLPKNFQDYLRADSIKKCGFAVDGWSFTKYLCKLGGLLLLFFLPIFILAFNSYVAVSRENIIYHPFFSITPRIYSFNEINQLNVSFSESYVGLHNTKDINASIEIITENGDEIDLSAPFLFSRSGLSYNSNAIEELYKTFRNQGIIVNIEKLSPGSIMSIQSFCPDKQKIFYTIFEIDYQIVPHSGCL